MTELPVNLRTHVRALGWTSRGPIWPVLGGSEPPAEPPVEPVPVVVTDPPKADEGKSKADEGKPKAEPDETARLRDERDRLKTERDEIADKLKGIEDKDKSELDLAKRDRDEAKTRVDEMQSEIDKLRLDNAFLKHNTVTWHSIEDAQGALDRGLLKVDKSGTVTGMDQAITKLAEAKPWLVKTENTLPPKAGTPGNGDGRGGDAPDRATLAATYPALRAGRG